MPRTPSKTFTEKELEIMQVVWELGEATAREIQEQLPGERHYNSVLTIIRELERKGHLTHRVAEYFYHKLQYFGSELPGRQKRVEQYRSGWVTPAEAFYGEDYQCLPEERLRLMRKRGGAQRPGFFAADAERGPREEA